MNVKKHKSVNEIFQTKQDNLQTKLQFIKKSLIL